MDRFDQRSVSFVSVTQHFNTTTSLGRLTLNILLSFAHYAERGIMQSPSTEVAGGVGILVGFIPPYPGLKSEGISPARAVNPPRRNPTGPRAFTAYSFSAPSNP